MRNCYLCGWELTDANTTKEHIFLQAIGGRLYSKELLCKTCNSTVGDTIDAALAEQLNVVSNLLDIQRDRGRPPVLRVQEAETGEPLRIAPGGKPEYVQPKITEEQLDDGIRYHVEASNLRQAREVIRGLKRKHPELDEEEILRTAKKQERYMEHMTTLSVGFGGDKAFRSVCKTAVNYYLYTCGSDVAIAHLVPYIKGEEERRDIVFWAQSIKDPFVRAADEVSHNIIVRGDAAEGLLYAYVDFFGAYWTIVVLNRHYDGDDINESYSYDVVSRKSLERSGKIQLGRTQVESMAGASPPQEEFHHRLSTLVEKIHRKQTREHVRELLDRAVANFVHRHPDIGEMTQEMCEDLYDETLTQLMPWIEHAFKESLIK